MMSDTNASFKSQHELSLLIPTNSSNTIQLFNGIPSVYMCLIFLQIEEYEFNCRNICKDQCIISKICIALVEKIINIPVFILADFLLWYFILGERDWDMYWSSSAL